MLQTFVAPKSQIEEKILERTKVKAKRTKEDHARHNSGGARKTTTTTTSLDDESNKSCIKESIQLLCDGY